MATIFLITSPLFPFLTEYRSHNVTNIENEPTVPIAYTPVYCNDFGNV